MNYAKTSRQPLSSGNGYANGKQNDNGTCTRTDTHRTQTTNPDNVRNNMELHINTANAEIVFQKLNQLIYQPMSTTSKILAHASEIWFDKVKKGKTLTAQDRRILQMAVTLSK